MLIGVERRTMSKARQLMSDLNRGCLRLTHATFFELAALLESDLRILIIHESKSRMFTLLRKKKTLKQAKTYKNENINKSNLDASLFSPKQDFDAKRKENIGGKKERWKQVLSKELLSFQ